MKISTRQSTTEEERFGAGQFKLDLTEDQLRLIASLLYVTRLGTSGMPKVASELVQLIEQAAAGLDVGLADSFAEFSFDSIQAFITETDDIGIELKQIAPDNYIIELQ